MPQTRFLPSKLQAAWARGGGMGQPEALKMLTSVIIGNPTFVNYYDDFVGQSAGTWPASANWGYPATVGTGTEVIGIAANNVGGALSVATGVNSADSAYQAVGRHWRGTEGAYFICKLQIDRITTAKFECGLTDSITVNGAINAKATPTFNATDAACFVFDTTDDTLIDFMTVNAGVVGANVDGPAPVAATDIVFEIKLEGGFASGYINGQYIGGGAITSTAVLTPYVGVTAKSAAALTMLVDYMGCFGPRG